MNKLLVSAACMASTISIGMAEVSEVIKVNQEGYLTGRPKWAFISSTDALNPTAWHLQTVDGKTVHQGKPSVAMKDYNADETVWRIDFSEVNTPGIYQLCIDGNKTSYEIRISPKAFNPAFRTIMKGFYYQRSGIELKPEHAGTWARPSSHAKDAWLYTGFNNGRIQYGEHIDTAGGWRDAGDPNKKTVPGCVMLYHLLSAYELNTAELNRASWNIPKDPDFKLCDFLTEAKVELDWLLKMQRDDGAVWHAVTQANFFLGPEHTDQNKRYIMPISTTATADFAAVMSKASTVFRPVNAAYSKRCLDAAERAWQALSAVEFPTRGYPHDPPGINNTADYVDTEDTDEMIWAAAELFAATDRPEYKERFFELLESCVYPVQEIPYWKNVQNFGVISYLFKMKNCGNERDEKLRSAYRLYVDHLLFKIYGRGFPVSLENFNYTWGSNEIIGNFAFTFLTAAELFDDPRYHEGALSHINYLLGCNTLNQCFISGVGKKTVQHPHHIPSRYDNVKEPVPGLVVGGPNKYPVTWDLDQIRLIKELSPPPAAVYVDKEASYATNEPSGTYGSPLAAALAYFYKHEE